MSHMATNFERVRSIVMAAVGRPPEAWDAYLNEACGDDAGLREQVNQLLRAHRSGSGPLDDATLAADAAPPRPASGAVGAVIAGRYELLGAIGEGGMGTVWLAQQNEPVKRKVALKLIKLGMDSRQVLARFEAERQALAMMDHPNIAKVLDGGLTPDGRPFFVMELVKGTPITEFCDARRLNLKQRLELFVPICQAIQHAHQKGIIHRDIKPSNVLVALYDEYAIPKVIDFGVAKATGQSLTDETINTHFGGVIGTPQYMSPEQATLNNLDIDTRSDVYSLGILLYELLTGSPPFTKQELEKKGLMEVLRVVREEEPPKPSDKISTANALATLSANRNVEPRRLTQMLRSELDWIVLKALEKDRARRYETANGLAADVLRYLGGEPVLAHPPGAGYRLKKFVRRYRVQVLAGSLMLITLLAGIAGTTAGLIQANKSKQAAEARRVEAEGQRARAEAGEKLARDRLVQVAAERDAKEAARADAEAISTFLTEAFQSPDPTRDGRSIKVVELLDKSAKKLESDLTSQPVRRAKLQSALARTYWALGLARQAVPLQESAREYLNSTLGPEHLDTLNAMNLLANIYADAGRRDEALKLREEVLAQARKVLGPEHAATLAAMHNLAVSYDLAGRRDEALKLREQTLPLRRKVNGPEHPNTLKAMNNLAVSYSNAGRNDEALQLRLETLSLCRKVLGPEHPETLLAMHVLGHSYMVAERFDEAIPLQEEVLSLRRRILGPEHPDTIGAMTHLAISYAARNRSNEAMKLQEEVLTLTRKVLGDEHPQTLKATTSLAASYAAAGRTDDALKMNEQTLALSRKVNGPEHPDTVAAMDSLASLYSSAGAGRARDALKLREELQPLCRKAFGAKDPNTIEATCNLARLLAWSADPALRDPKRAVAFASEAVAIAPKNPLAVTALGITQYRAGEYAAAIKTLATAVEMKGKFDPEAGFVIAMARWQTGDKAQARLDYAAAVAWMEKANSKQPGLVTWKAEAAALIKDSGDPPK
jgi:serine/threonine protein kinase/tetratricopeptide (TPR) repeat protein